MHYALIRLIILIMLAATIGLILFMAWIAVTDHTGG